MATATFETTPDTNHTNHDGASKRRVTHEELKARRWASQTKNGKTHELIPNPNPAKRVEIDDERAALIARNLANANRKRLSQRELRAKRAEQLRKADPPKPEKKHEAKPAERVLHGSEFRLRRQTADLVAQVSQHDADLLDPDNPFVQAILKKAASGRRADGRFARKEEREAAAKLIPKQEQRRPRTFKPVHNAYLAFTAKTSDDSQVAVGEN